MPFLELDQARMSHKNTISINSWGKGLREYFTKGRADVRTKTELLYSLPVSSHQGGDGAFPS